MRARNGAYTALAAVAFFFAGCLLVQVFLAGMGVFDGPERFEAHRNFGYTIGMLTLVMVVIAVAAESAGPDRPLRPHARPVLVAVRVHPVPRGSAGDRRASPRQRCPAAGRHAGDRAPGVGRPRGPARARAADASTRRGRRQRPHRDEAVSGPLVVLVAVSSYWCSSGWATSCRARMRSGITKAISGSDPGDVGQPSQRVPPLRLRDPDGRAGPRDHRPVADRDPRRSVSAGQRWAGPRCGCSAWAVAVPACTSRSDPRPVRRRRRR
jgi:hypothetical protein